MTVSWPRVLTPSQLSQMIRAQKNPSTALRIFNEAKSKYPNYYHNGPVYATMISILGKSGRVTEMDEVITQMREDSCECKDSVFVIAIKSYAKAGFLDEAISLYKDIPLFNCVNWTQSFNTMLEILVNESKLEDAYRLFVEGSLCWEVNSRMHSLKLFMKALCDDRHSDLALQIFQEMDYQGCYPDREAYAILMKGLCKDRRLYEATHLLYSMFWRISQKGSGEDVVIYRILLDALCDEGKIEEAMEILGKIVRKGLKAPKRCLRTADPSQLRNEGNIAKIKRLVIESLIKGGVPSTGSYTAMAVDLFEEGKIEEAEIVLTEMQRSGFRCTHSIYEAKVDALCREGRVDEALTVIEEDMVKGSCVATVGLHNIVINGLCNAGKSESALEYFKKISKQVGCAANEETYSTVLNALCCESRFVEASHVLEEMSRKSFWPCADAYNLVIKGLCYVGKQYEAVLWLEEMISQGKLPDISVWNSLAASVCNLSFFDLNSEIVDRLRS